MNSLPTPSFVTATNANSIKTKVVTKYVAVPLEAQGMSLISTKTRGSKILSKVAAVNAANKKATQFPHSNSFINSIMTYNFVQGAVYVIYTAPGQITDIEFTKGEQINSYASGDTMRWKLAKTYSGTNPVREHLLVKPTAANLSTTLAVMTNQRVYHLQLKSTQSAFMSAVMWNYPNVLVTKFGQSPTDNTSGKIDKGALSDVDISKMNTNYQVEPISGDTSSWQPNLVFDDGLKTFIRFPNSVQVGNMPILMVDTGENHYASAINYRFAGHYMIVDILFDHAQLVMGDKHDKNRAVVQINREQ